jgi:tetratricopeptide (TPR) repeat protein
MGRAIELLTAVAGPSNPHLDLAYANWGDALARLGRLGEATSAYEHALALQVGRPPGAITVSVRAGLAGIESNLGNHDRAIQIANTALEAAEVANEQGGYRWLALVIRGRARGSKGDLVGQAADCARVLAEQKARGAVSPDLPYGPDSLGCLGEAALAAHRLGSAIEYFEQSVALERRQEYYELPLAKFALARALWLACRDPERARGLAVSARGALAGQSDKQKELAALDAWLSASSVAQCERHGPR